MNYTTFVDRKNMNNDYYIIEPMQMAELKLKPPLIISLDRNTFHPLIRNYSIVPFIYQ